VKDRYPLGRALTDLRSDLRRYRVTDGTSPWVTLILSPGSIASVHYRIARCVWSYDGAFKVVALALRVPLVLLRRLVEIWSGVSIPPQTRIGPGLYIGHFGGIILNGDAILGQNCNLSQNVTIGVGGRGSSRGCPTLGDRVYIGPGAKLFGAIVIGNDVAIGANAVVTRGLPDNSVAVGVPARIVDTRGSFDLVMV
jgi:serine O-acetyltransferase